MRRYTIFLLIFFPLLASSQVVYEDINNVGIYEFLDELTNLKVIEINSVVKPYSRQFIAEKLKEVLDRLNRLDRLNGLDSLDRLDKRVLQMNKRQRKELTFYWQDYQIDGKCKSEPRSSNEELGVRNKERINNEELSPASGIRHPASDCSLDYDHKLGFLFKNKPAFAVPLNPLAFQYKDRLFTLSLRPIGGIEYMMNDNGSMYHRYWGAAAFMYIGKNFGGYASLRDNSASVLMSMPEYFTLTTGGVYKINEGGRKGGDWSEMRGGITASWKWGSFGLYKDFFTWGNNNHGANILSAHAPSFPYIQLHLKPAKWFEFYYIHGWLFSKVVDSTRSYYTDNGIYRIVFHNKYIAANMFTVTPWRGLNISFGNSIVYSGDINPAFLIPFMFFKSVDHSSYFNNNAGSNAQVFVDISSRQIRHLNLYVTLFIDELKMSRITKKDEHNFTSWKVGFRLCDLPIPNLSLTGEYTMTQPGTYQHNISTTTYTSNYFNLGHYMRDNSQEVYVELTWKPIRGLQVKGSYLMAEHGDDVIYGDVSGDYIVKVPFLGHKTWQNDQVEFSAGYQISSGIYIWIQYLNTNRQGDVKFGPQLLHGKTSSMLLGFNIGF